MQRIFKYTHIHTQIYIVYIYTINEKRIDEKTINNGIVVYHTQCLLDIRNKCNLRLIFDRFT